MTKGVENAIEGAIMSYLEARHKVSSLEKGQLADLVDNGRDLGVDGSFSSIGRIPPPRGSRDAEELCGSPRRASGSKLTSAALCGEPTRHGHFCWNWTGGREDEGVVCFVVAYGGGLCTGRTVLKFFELSRCSGGLAA